MPVNDELGKRMKRYEAIPQISLMRRTPVAIRIDGKAFHTFTKHLKKPWDYIFQGAMQETMKYLCQNIQNCVFGYQQSDEITLILVDYDTLNTDAWFGYEVQKLCSIAASMATMKFNQKFTELAVMWYEDFREEWHHDPKDEAYAAALEICVNRGAMFDARCFNIPKEEVTNLVYWRQIDAIRNSIQSNGQAKFTHSELMNKNTSQVKDMLKQIGYDWDTIPICAQRGVACIKEENGWKLDFTMPILKDEGRAYVDNLIFIGD